MSDDGHKCKLCRKSFGTITEKITHNCPEKPEERCEKKRCGREPKEGSRYCPAHHQQCWIRDEPEVEKETREVGVFEVEMCWSAELRTKVKAVNKHHAYDKVEELQISGELEPELVHKVHEDAEKVGSEIEVVNEEKVGERPNYLKLNEVEN